MQLSFFDTPPVETATAQTPVGPSRLNGGGNAIKSDLDYRIPDALPTIGSGGQMTKVKLNLEAIRLLKELQAAGRQATPEEQSQLVMYSGWGHTAQPFHPLPKGKWAELQAEMRPLFSEEEWRAAAASTINAHYTSPEVIRFMWRVVERLGFKGGKILEPAAGVGHFFGLMPEQIKAASKLYACELDLLSGAMVKQLYPSARVLVDGFENAPYEADFFDLIISNVPFSDIRVNDPAIYENGRGHLADTGLHNYYFIKALELARPGGLVAFITSRFTMDSLETKVRAYLEECAWFLGAVRLPVTAFKKNAHTEVTTDVIFLLKKDGRGHEIPAYNFVNTVSKGDYRLNEFYDFEAFAMIGQMQLEGGRYEDAFECVVPHVSPGGGKDFDLAAALADRLRIFSENLYQPAVAKPRRQLVVEPDHFDNPPTDPWLRAGSFAQDEYYRIWQKTKGGWVRATLEGRQLQRVRGLIEVRDAFHRTIAANVDFVSEAQLDEAQTELNLAYRRFVARWGYLHEPANIAAFSEDVDSDNILALERWDPDTGRAAKAAIFSERLLTPETRPLRADSAQEALIISLRETGKVELGRMSELTERSEAELVQELSGQIYYDPDLKAWVPADEYLSGNIRQKLLIAEHEAALEQADSWSDKPSRYQPNILALREVLPRDAGPKDIFVQLGAPWVPKDIIETFIQDRLFGDPDHRHGRIKVLYLQALGLWRLNTDQAGRLMYSAENRKTWGTNRMDGVDLIEKILNGQQATVYDTFQDGEGKERRKVNQEATLVARAKQSQIREAFDKWVWQDEARTERLVQLYNERFNSTVPRCYNGTPLYFPQMSPEIVLRQIQRNVIWRGLQSRALMMAHQVGFGKTYSQTGMAMRLKQMGLRQRICIVVKRATFGQFVAAFRQAYPLARISPIASGQTPQHRRRQLARIATEDYDVIITTHPVFAQIPLKPETKLDYLRKQVDELEQAILEARGERISTKELQKAKKRLEGKIRREMEKGIGRDPNTLYFEDLGLDALFVDESGAYKNLWFPSVMTRISGVGGSESGRAFDMLLKIRHLQQRDGFIAFATGTPVENSISEVWVMMSYLMPQRLRELGLHHFDAWAATFGKVVTAVEMKPDGSGFRMASRFASFNNLPQLKKLWWEVADCQMDAAKAGIERPEIATGKPIGIQAEAYPELKQIVQTLANRANNLADKDPSEDNILKIMSDADKASLDARLLGEFPVVDGKGKATGETVHVTWDYPGSKVNLCASQVAQIYHDTYAAELPGQPGWHPLTQLIFLDSSTPKGSQWSVYADLRQKLIERGVKPDEIAFAQDYSDDDRKAKLAAALNAGRIRVAIGHTEIMGIGLNCQRLLVALHHLDCPWKPAWLEQREGRIHRQGNLCPQISIYRYVMAGSFDVYRWQTVERKYGFITNFNSDDLSVNSIEDPGLAVLSAREMTALATGNTAIIRQVELQTRLRVLIAQRREYDDGLYMARGRKARLESELAGWQATLARRRTILERVRAEGIEAAMSLGAQLYELCAPHFEVTGQKIEIAQLYGLRVLYEGTVVEEIEAPERPRVDRNYWGAADPLPEAKAEEAPPEPKKEIKRRVYLENEELEFQAGFTLRVVEETRARLNASTLGELFENEVPTKVRGAEGEVAERERKLAEVGRILATPFEGDEEINAIEAELAGVAQTIAATLGETEVEQRQAARVALEIGQEVEEPETEAEVELD